jgi:hypothetical protein
MEKKNVSLHGVTSLMKVRASLSSPTSLAALLAECTGAKVRTVHPGLIIAHIQNERAVSIRVRRVNPYQRAIQAYNEARVLVPTYISAGVERWERTHRRDG